MLNLIEDLVSLLIAILLLAAAFVWWVIDGLWRHRIEALAAAFGLAGAWLLAMKGEHAAWGWWYFLGSNGAWLYFGWTRGHWFLVLQQVGFTASSVWGIWMWMR